MIVIEGLEKHYGSDEARTQVLDDVDLTIEEGEFVSIIGTSGSGKTTLLNIIGGLDRDWTGRVEVDGRDFASLGDNAMAAMRSRHFGFVFQQFNLLDHLTSLENVALPDHFRPDGGSHAEGVKRARELLERVGLSEKMGSRPPKLSGGQKQRVAIARALFNSPDVILCDEPTGSLDRKTGVQILDIFRRLNEDDDITIIMVTHEEHIARMSRRIIRLEDGLVVADEANEPVQPDIDFLGADGTSEEELGAV